MAPSKPVPAQSPRGVPSPAPLSGVCLLDPISSGFRQGEAWHSRGAMPQPGPRPVTRVGDVGPRKGKGLPVSPRPPAPSRAAPQTREVRAPPPPPTRCAHSLHNSVPTRPQAELQAAAVSLSAQCFLRGSFPSRSFHQSFPVLEALTRDLRRGAYLQSPLLEFTYFRWCSLLMM